MGNVWSRTSLLDPNPATIPWGERIELPYSLGENEINAAPPVEPLNGRTTHRQTVVDHVIRITEEYKYPLPFKY